MDKNTIYPFADTNILTGITNEQESQFLKTVTLDELKVGVPEEKLNSCLSIIKEKASDEQTIDAINYLQDQYFSEGNNEGWMVTLFLQGSTNIKRSVGGAFLMIGLCYHNKDSLPKFFLNLNQTDEELKHRQEFWYREAKKCGDSDIIEEAEIYLGERPDYTD